MSLSKIFYICFALLVCIGCNKRAAPVSAQKPLILVSIAPYKLIAERIAGPNFAVETVAPAAADPHSFEPTANQVLGLQKAEVWFCIGESFEKKIIPILQNNIDGLTVADLREGIELIEEELGCHECSMDHLDRHIWLSPKLFTEQAKIIEKTLCEKYPEQKDLFLANSKNLSDELRLLDTEIKEILKGVEKRTLLVSHPAFGYFCKDYDIVQLSVEYEGKDPRPKHLEEILKRAVVESAEIALALPQYNNKGAQMIARQLHKPIRYIDPYSPDYFETMRKLAKIIADPYAN